MDRVSIVLRIPLSGSFHKSKPLICLTRCFAFFNRKGKNEKD
jgi:hypothetical protein